MTGKGLNRIMIVAGEASGDTHAAKLVRAFQEIDPKIEFFGAAGPKMREAGVEPVVHSDGLSVVGLLEIGRVLPMFWKAFKELRRVAVERRPDVAILVDFPDFNLKLARTLKKRGLSVVYYISPQLWAWRKYRIKTIRNYVDLVVSILPFEKEWYARHGIDHVEYVGSPLAREVHSECPRDEFRKKHRIDPERPLIALLPGSRQAEVTRVLPEMIASAKRLRDINPLIQFAVALPTGADASEAAIDQKDGEWLKQIVGETFDVLNASDAAAITSGTATLEAGIIGTPMVIVYKTSAINYRLLRPLIDVEHFGLINLIAGERVAAELIQDEFTPEILAAELLRLLDPSVNAETRTKLSDATEKLGQGGASKRAAEVIIDLLNNRAN
jgi:lipid-A-disaccharide synthase